MMKLFSHRLVAPLAALALFVPSAANALGVSIVNVSSSGGNTAFLLDGDILTVDLRAENNTNIEVFGVGLAVLGMDPDGDGDSEDGLVFVGGSVAADLFSTVSVPGPPPASFGGLGNVLSTAVERGSPAVPDNPFIPGDQSLPAVPIHAVLFEGITVGPGATGDGSEDVGVDGGLVGAGDVHFRVQFQAVAGDVGQVASRAFQLDFGAAEEVGQVFVGAGGQTLSVVNQTVTFNVVPEPGTAMLLGLGLAGLAAARRD